ncbi:MAG: ubiquinone/menaquinone biosynthesis methyltransferase [Methanoregula sp. PtaB.Bin085]|nr:MAG: ubiquinone/menaquinone biosynthesis methyltransferase [Methanoregula sp. PtaB.Bin085]
MLDAACGTGIVAVDLNEWMLRVGRHCTAREGTTTIEWYQSDITRMPVSDGEFDMVLCQQGLRFFPDKAAALQEMARVLAPGGRLALSVWGRAEKSPHVGIICDVFRDYFGEDSTTIFKVACSLSDPAVLRNLAGDAGFTGISIRSGVKIARHPSPAELLPAYFSAFPVAAQISALPEEERDGMFRCMMTQLVPSTENNGLAVPTENIPQTAEKE